MTQFVKVRQKYISKQNKKDFKHKKRELMKHKHVTQNKNKTT